MCVDLLKTLLTIQIRSVEEQNEFSGFCCHCELRILCVHARVTFFAWRGAAQNNMIFNGGFEILEENDHVTVAEGDYAAGFARYSNEGSTGLLSDDMARCGTCVWLPAVDLLCTRLELVYICAQESMLRC